MIYELRNLECFERLPKKMRELKYFLAGFADGEACFSVSVKKQENTRFGWVLDPLFQVTQHKDNRCILEVFQRVLQCGRIIEKPGQKDTLIFLVDNRRQLNEKVIPFFRKYKLVCKYGDFQKFARIVEGLENREHWTREGFTRLLKLAFQMNLEGKQRRDKLEEILKDLKV